MIAVSDSFKKAIKSDNREIHGYVDVVYDKQEGDYSVTQIPTISPLSKSDGTDLIDDIKKMKNYATLENNYFLLDGSFILANSNTLEESGGYISDDIFSNIQNKTITLVSTETGYVTTKGFTIFFKDNIPFDFDIVITTEYGEGNEEDTTITFEVRNNTSRNYQKIFEEDTTIKQLDLIIYTTEYNDRRIRISDICLSLANMYEGEELVKFEVDEEIDLLAQSLPINTCVVNLNNYPDENGDYIFDPINPHNIIKYLTEDTTIQLYIGVLTEDDGVEYVNMGIFYLNDWSSDNDGNVTMSGVSCVQKIQSKTLTSDGTFLTRYKQPNDINNYLKNLTGITFKLLTGTYWNGFLTDTSLMGWLSARLPSEVMKYNNNNYTKYMFHSTRNNTIEQSILNETALDTLDRTQLIDDVQYTTKTVLNNINISDIVLYDGSRETKRQVLSTTHTLSKTTEYVWYTLNNFVLYSDSTFSYSVTSGSGSATLVDKNYYMIYVKFTGSVGSKITINYNGSPYRDLTTITKSFSNSEPNGESLSLDFTHYFNPYDDEIPVIAQYYLTMDAKYKVTGTTIGDPSLESGDTISIQTRYTDTDDGYKNIIITKQKFTYDGGLQCELEGRGN